MYEDLSTHLGGLPLEGLVRCEIWPTEKGAGLVDEKLMAFTNQNWVFRVWLGAFA